MNVETYLKESKRIKRVLQYREQNNQSVGDLPTMVAFIDECLEEMGLQGKALVLRYIHGLNWFNVSSSLNISENTFARWRRESLKNLSALVDAAGIDLSLFDSLMGADTRRAAGE